MWNKFSEEGRTNRYFTKIKRVSEQLFRDLLIIDKGVGIPQEDIPHLFERFYRAKNVTVAEIPGSGIGLYIVNSIVTELGEEFWSNPLNIQDLILGEA